MNPLLEIFSQGEEIVTGQVVDTNATWLSGQVVMMGFDVIRHTAVGDRLEDLVQVLRDISTRADCCICTGGLGPTSDDLTAEAVAKAFDIELVFDEIAYGQIQRFFNNRNRQMPACNRKQAMLPQGSIRLDNHIGTAPGFALKQGRCWFAFVPGVPSEMRHLFLEQIKPKLAVQFELHPSQLVTIRTIGIGESDLQERINKVAIPPQVQLGFRAEIGEVQTKLLFPFGYPQAKLQNLTNVIVETIGDAVFAVNGIDNPSGDLVSVLDQLMVAKNLTLTIVESVSQGLLAAKMPGMRWLLSAAYEPSLERMAQKLGIEHHTDRLITAKAIMVTIQKNTGADLVLFQFTSNECWGQPNKDQPITLVTVLLADGEFYQADRNLAGDIQRRQQQAAMITLDLLRRYLQGKEIR